MSNRSTLPTTLCCAVALFACSASAWADTRTGSSFSDVTGFSWQLIDLDLNDGITPELTITSQTIHVDSGYDSDYTDFVYDVYDERDSYGSTAANGAHGGANAALGAAESHLSANLSSDSHYTAGTWGSSESSWHFDLTPSTGVLFNASGNAGVAASDIVSSYAFSYHEFRGSLGDSANGSNQFRQYFDLSTWGLSGAQSLSGDFVLSGYLHTDKRAESGSFEFSHRNSVSLYGPTPAVPEPETYAMLLAGLALVGAGARRRARRAGG